MNAIPSMPVPTAAKKVPLIASPEEVKALQAIRDLRLAGKPYETKKAKFFAAFRRRHGITGKPLIKIETEKEDRLGIVQYCGNHAKVMVVAVAGCQPS